MRGLTDKEFEMLRMVGGGYCPPGYEMDAQRYVDVGREGTALARDLVLRGLLTEMPNPHRVGYAIWKLTELGFLAMRIEFESRRILATTGVSN